MRKMIIGILVLAGLFVPPATFSASVQDILGTWAFSQIGHRNSGHWYLWAGKVVFHPDGTGMLTGELNENGLLYSGPWPFTYSVLVPPLPAEIMQIDFNFSGFPMQGFYYIKAGRDMLLLRGSEYTEQQPFGLLLRLDPSKTYSAADLNGRFYGIGYQHIKSAPDKYSAWSLSVLTDGLGNLAYQSTRNENGAIIPQDTSSPYALEADGKITTSGPWGYLSGNGQTMVLSKTDDPSDLFFTAFIKQGSGNYSNGNLEGLWVVSGFGDYCGTGFYSLRGAMLCDSSGACRIGARKQVGGVNSDYDFNLTLAVEPDGTFRTHSTSPLYAGALGDEGQVFFANRSFDPALTPQREILIGIRFTRYALLPLLLK